MLTDADRERLHELRLRAFVTVADDAPERAGWQALVDTGYATAAKGRVMLSPDGRAAANEFARATGAAVDVAEAAYESFVPLNQRLLKVCHDWQLQRGGVPNDHTDPDYDHKVIRRLHDVHAGARRVLVTLVGSLPRFAAYEPRFEAALTQLDGGDRMWFASPACDSYHTVWMQFHEDLLLASGRARGDEETR